MVILSVILLILSITMSVGLLWTIQILKAGQCRCNHEQIKRKKEEKGVPYIIEPEEEKKSVAQIIGVDEDDQELQFPV